MVKVICFSLNQFRQAIAAQQDTINQLCAQVIQMHARIDQLCTIIDRQNRSGGNESGQQSSQNDGKLSGEGHSSDQA